MSYGFAAYNDGAECQVDGQYPNFGLFATGKAIVNIYNDTPQHYYVGMSTVSVPNSGTNPIIAFKVQSSIWTSIIGTSTSSMDAYAYEPNTGILTETATIPYVIFRRANPADLQSHGIAVYSSFGDLVFHSGIKWMKVMGVYPVTPPGLGGVGSTLSVDDADNHYFAIVPLQTGSRYIGIPPYGFNVRYATMLQRVTSKTINYGPCMYAMQSGGAGPSPSWSYLTNATILELSF